MAILAEYDTTFISPDLATLHGHLLPVLGLASITEDIQQLPRLRTSKNSAKSSNAHARSGAGRIAGRPNVPVVSLVKIGVDGAVIYF